jgi:rSAM/selenodomain-associated transferase 1
VPMVAVGIFCKTPSPGLSKTRLSPPLRPEDCALLSACFIRDLAATIDGVAMDGDVTPFAVYTPSGTERTLRTLLSASFHLLLQRGDNFGARLFAAISDLLARGYAGAVLVNADSPTLPASILRAAVDAVLAADAVVLSPALDGGYTLIGLSRAHGRVFADIAWSTPQVHRQTTARAAEIGVPVVDVPPWYDVDDKQTLRLLQGELAGERLPPPLTDIKGADAPATRRFLAHRLAPLGESATW